MSTIDHLEKTLADNYRKEIDQEENVWRSLPFFAATLALQLAAIVGLADKLPPLGGTYLWWLMVPIGVAVATTLATLIFMAAAIAPARFRYIASEPALRDYATQLDEAERAHPEIGAAAQGEDATTGSAQPHTEPSQKSDALSVFKAELAFQYALATHHNRLVNQRRAWLRSIAGLCMLTSVLATLVLVGVTIYHHITHGLAATTAAPLAGEQDHGAQAERRGRPMPDGQTWGRAGGDGDQRLEKAPALPGTTPGDARGPQGLVDQQRAPRTGGGVRAGGPGAGGP